MKTLVLSVFSLFFCVALTATEPTTSGEVDVDASSISWVGKKVTGKHEGTIKIKSGRLIMNDGAIAGGTFEIDMTSINVTDLSGNMKGKLEGHLNSDDFFSTASYPVATVEITSANKKGDNTYDMIANVTIKGITNPVSFSATIDGNKAMADISVDRTLFDVRYGSGKFFEGLGDKMIYDNFDLSVTLVMK